MYQPAAPASTKPGLFFVLIPHLLYFIVSGTTLAIEHHHVTASDGSCACFYKSTCLECYITDLFDLVRV